MAHLTNKIFTSPFSLYSKHLNYELWAHLQTDHVLIQLKTFLNDGIIKLFTNTVSSIICSNFIIGPQSLFSILNKEQSTTIDAKNGIIKIQINSNQQTIKTIKKQIHLQQKIDQPSLDNWMLLNIIKQGSVINKTEEESQKNWQKCTSGQIRPIIHDNSMYRFEAELDIQKKQIKTQLYVKNIEESNSKKKSFKSIIRQKQWSEQYEKKFINIETLFEHLRNNNNYQVLQNKGLIKIRNQPNIIKQNRGQKYQNRILSQKIQMFNSKKIKRKNTEQNQLQKKISLIQQQLNLSKQLQVLGNKIENKLRIFIKQSQRQINKKQRQRLQGYDNKFAELQRQLKKYFKQKLKQYTDQLKTQILKSIKPAQSIINTRKSHIFQVIKPFNQINQQNIEDDPKPQIKIYQSLLLSPNKIKKFAIDQHNSSQFTQFKLENNGIVQYIGAWDWTQIYTNVPVLFGYTYKFTYKIIHSVYNAIAIGVSGATNIIGRSSLTKANSISYWGDGQIWEGSKVKQEGRGFRVGETITMQVNREKGSIQWHVNGVVKARYDSIFLKSKQNIIYAYLQMYDSGDKIQLIQFKT